MPDLPHGRAPSVRTRSETDKAGRRPVHVVWEITLACNLRCVHCGSRAGKPRADELSTEECRDLIRQLGALGTREITIIGGEAYLRRDWLEIVRAIAEAGMKCSLQTGGRALTRAKIEAAAAAGLAAAGVSVDGLGPVHDRLRGVPGSFEQALRVIRDLSEVGIRPGVNSQVNRQSMGDFPALYRVLRDAGIKFWQIQLTVATGNANDQDDLLIQPFELPDFYDRLAEIFLEAKADGVQLFAGNNVGYFGPHEHLWRTLTDEPAHWEACQASETTIGIEADGTIKGCPSLHKDLYGGGTVRDRPLARIWDAMAGSVRPRIQAPLWGFCGSCRYGPQCGAGCTWTGAAVAGRPGNNPFCDYRARTLRRQGLRERVVPAAPAPGLPFDSAGWTLSLETLDGAPAPAGSVARDPTAPGGGGSLQPCPACRSFASENDPACFECGAALTGARPPATAEIIARIEQSLARMTEISARCEAELAGFERSPAA